LALIELLLIQRGKAFLTRIFVLAQKNNILFPFVSVFGLHNKKIILIIDKTAKLRHFKTKNQ